MMNFRKSIPRRAFLRGAGASIALPLLDAMVPAFARAINTDELTPQRFSTSYVPNGIIMNRWTPETEGSGFEITPTLQPLAGFRENMLLISGLAHNNARALVADEAGGFHPRASSVFLTGAHPKRTEGADFRVGTSVDQIMAKETEKKTQLGSLELAVDSTELLGVCDTGYTCAYSNTLCWRTPTTPVPMLNHPREVFERMFGDANSTDRQTRISRMAEDRSVLDYVRQSATRLIDRLGSADTVKLSDYFDAVRDVERRIQLAEEQSSRELPSFDRPAGVPAKYTEHTKLMFDLELLAFQSDITRVATFMMGREQGTRVFDELGIADAYHPLTHHQGDPVKIGKVIKIDLLHTQLFAYFLERLRSIADGNGTLLDHVAALYGCCISDGNIHLNHDLPILLIGGGANLSMGRHVRFPPSTPMSNFYVTLLNQFGLQTQSFGDSNGKLPL
jgi:hypothetical protein